MEITVWHILVPLLIIFFIYIFAVEPKQLRIVTEKIRTEDDALVLLQLSDLHLKDLKISYDRIFDNIYSVSPDIIAITGDMLDVGSDLILLDKFLTAGRFPCPVYVTLGNHDAKVVRTAEDIEKFRERLSGHGLVLLHNETAIFSKHGRKFLIVGLADTQSEFYDKVKIDSLLRSGHGTKIVLAHNPDAACDIPPGSCSCVISGHLHGGQIWMPFNFEFSILRKDCLPKQGYKQGLYLVHGNRLYISRGIGTSLIPARFLSRPEITVLYL